MRDPLPRAGKGHGHPQPPHSTGSPGRPRAGGTDPGLSALSQVEPAGWPRSPVPLADGDEFLEDGAEAGPLAGVVLPAALHQPVHLLGTLLGGVQPHTWGAAAMATGQPRPPAPCPLQPRPACPMGMGPGRPTILGSRPRSGAQSQTLATSLTLLHGLPCLLVAEVGVGDGAQAEGFPQQDPEAPDVTLRAVSAWGHGAGWMLVAVDTRGTAALAVPVLTRAGVPWLSVPRTRSVAVGRCATDY